MLPHRLTNFEIKKCCQNKPRHSHVYSINNVPKNKRWPIRNKYCLVQINSNSLDNTVSG